MNWARVYNQLMIRAIPRGLNKRNLGYYVERHHVIPKSMGGSDSADNFVLLTGREHKKIFKELNIAGTNPSSFISVVKKFREGWIPMEDEEWVDRFQGWTLEINPFKDIS